jgi:protein required for attachment to host cells
MSETCIIVAARNHARFFTVQSASEFAPSDGPKLVETDKLHNQEAEMAGTELWSNVRAGRNRSNNGGGHGYGDHRNRHEIEVDKRFATDVAQRAHKLVKAKNSKHVVLVAQSRTLGNLRDAMSDLSKGGVRVSEIPKDLSRLAPHDLQDLLSSERIVPGRRRS